MQPSPAQDTSAASEAQHWSACAVQNYPGSQARQQRPAAAMQGNYIGQQLGTQLVL